jgi:hypothetical protein
MRVRLGLLVSVVGAMLLVPAQTAAADGGAYIDFDQTHYLAGTDPARGVAYVAIPQPHQDLLERGPFYVYVVPRGWIREGRPLPEGTIRVGTASIEHDSRTTFRITTSFTVPDLPGDYYDIQMCNEPCTISGFRESLSGRISIVQTQREATLLNEQQRLFGRNWHLRRQVRKADREAQEFQASMDALEADRDALIEEVANLEGALSRTQRSDSAAGGRPLVEPWALVAIAIAVIVALASVGMALVFSRRSGPRIVVPDTIAELDEEATETLART